MTIPLSHPAPDDHAGPETAFDRITAALAAAGSRVTLAGAGRPDEHADAQCPAHQDRTASLRVTRCPAGVLVHCHAGCGIDAVLDALALVRRDLFDDPAARRNGYTVVAEYPYRDETGTVLSVKERRWPKGFAQYRPTPGGGRAYRLDGVRRVLYRLPEVLAAVAAGDPVWVTEGEKDADALTRAGVCATTWPDGAWQPETRPKWRPDYTTALTGAQVVVVADDDPSGRHTAGAIAQLLAGTAVSVRVVLPAAGKDAADHLAAGHSLAAFRPLPASPREQRDGHQVHERPDGHAARPQAGYGPGEGPPGAQPSEPPEPAGLRWDGDPVPLSPRRLLPPFPVDALPGWASDMVAAVTEFLQTPPDLAGCIVLAVLSTAAGGRAVVEVRPGWREPLNLYVVVALPPGERKSPAFKALVAPILAAERDLIAAATPRIDEAELHWRVAKARAERTAKAAENALSGEAQAEHLAEASDAAAVLRELTIPGMPRLVADDITVEAAASLLAEQGGRLAVLSAEGGIFATLAGRYSGIPNLEVFLKGHSGDLLRVDRKGRPPEHVEAPALTLGLAVQPEILTDIAAMPGFRGRGLLGRILYSLPTSTLGRRRIGTPPPPEPVAAAYAENVRALVASLADWTDPAVLPLSPAAAAGLLQLEADLEPQLAPGAALAHLTDWAGKLTGATARLAGLLHLATHLRDGWGRPIEATTLDDAARLARYYLNHALAVFDLMGADPLIDDARHLLDWITRTGANTFTRRDAHNPNRARFAKAGDLDPALALLTEHGWIQPLDPAPRPGLGRPPSPRYVVHPAALDPRTPAQNSQKSQNSLSP